MIRFLAALFLLGATAWYVDAHPPENLALGSGRLSSCPTRFGPWNGTELSFEDAVVEELAADDLLVRRYVRGRETAWLCVVVHRHRRYGAHDPKLCYESQGYMVEREGRARVPLLDRELEVNRFVADRPRDRRLVYYWWTTHGLSTADAGAFRARMALRGALESRSWGAFVRVETVIAASEQAADSAASDFARRVAAELPAVLAGSETAEAQR